MSESFSKKEKPITWQRLLISQYFIMQICLALEEIGFFEVLSKKPLTISELASRLHTQENLLRPCVEFLWSVTGFFKKEKDLIGLNIPNISSVLWGTKAYQPVMNNLACLLKNKKIYGKDLKRNGCYLQKSSELFSADAISKVISILGKEEKKSILVDLGCGSARALVEYCSLRRGRRGIGIDSDKEIVVEAKNNVAESGLSDTINIIQADVFDIKFWQPLIPNNSDIIFLASAVLHEVLNKGDSFLIYFLKTLRDNFPQSRFLIIEFDAVSFEKLKEETDPEKKLFSAMYMLWHPLTNQGMPQSAAVWRRLITNAGHEIKNVVDDLKYNLVIFDCQL